MLSAVEALFTRFRLILEGEIRKWLHRYDITISAGAFESDVGALLAESDSGCYDIGKELSQSADFDAEGNKPSTSHDVSSS